MHMSVTQFTAAPAMVNTARIRLALDRQSGDAKEYVGAIGGPHICSFVRMPPSIRECAASTSPRSE
jgi:hypothetical protein